MLVDKRLEFAANVSVAGTAGLALIGNQIPLSVAREIGGGDSGQLSLVITVTEAFAAASTDGTVTFILASDASAAIAVDESASVHVQSKAFTEAELSVVGTKIVLPVPVQQDGPEPYEAFVGLLARRATQTFSAGKVNAFLSRDIGSAKIYSAPYQA